MNFKRHITKVMLLLGLSLIALPASAVNPSDVLNASRYNTAGSTFDIGPLAASNFCYLSRVGFRELDTGSESSTCNVYISGAVWVLTATLGTSSDQDAWCSARCYTRN